METNTTASVERARSLSRWIERLFALLIVAAPLVLALSSAGFVFLYDDVYSTLQRHGPPPDAPPFLGIGRRLLLVGVLLLYAAPLWITATHVRRLFLSFSRDEVFTAHNVARLRAISGWLLVSVLMANVAQGLFILIATPPDPDFDLSLAPAIYAAMVYVIAYVLEEANRIADENRKFV
jgi:hypothetical protein